MAAIATLRESAGNLLCGSQMLSDGIRSPTASQFLQDAARYLTGSESNALEVYSAYRTRRDPHDPLLPYPITRPALPIPPSFTEFWSAVGLDKEIFAAAPGRKWQMSADRKWVRRLIPHSGVKGTERVIYRTRTLSGTAVSIAQTVGRETEIAIHRADSKDWDFAVYDAQGKVAASSLFYASGGADVSGPAPLTCLTCHYNRQERRFTNQPTSYLFSERLTNYD